jgi:hypothetical protein
LVASELPACRKRERHRVVVIACVLQQAQAQFALGYSGNWHDAHFLVRVQRLETESPPAEK